VFTGKPQDPEHYNEFLVDEIPVYLNKSLSVNSGLKIYMGGFWKFQGLAVEGLNNANPAWGC
jgi:hypothetical protein